MNWTTIWRDFLPSRAVNVVMFLMIAVIGLIDSLIPAEVPMEAFFLIPIILITWRQGPRSGYGATIVALAILLYNSQINKAPGASALLVALDSVGRSVAFFIIVAVLSRLRTEFKRQKTLATRDSLTGIHNRFGLMEVLRVELERTRRDEAPFALLLIDCDNFKVVNDSYGHQVGDELLKAVARTLSQFVRRSDVAGRLGGDEFVVYMAKVSEPDARSFCLQLKAKLDETMSAQRWPVTFSFGVSLFLAAPSTVENMVCLADKLMYETKRSGKNNIQFAIYGPT